MAGWLGNPQQDMFVITADKARSSYSEPSFIDGMAAVNNAILDAAPDSHEAVVTLTLTKTNPAYRVKQALERHGFDVVLKHDNEAKTSELTIRW